MDLIALLQQIAVPRPNHGSAVDDTARFLVQWLAGWGIDAQVQAFVLRPWIMLAVAVALVSCALLFVIAIVKKRPKIALVLALGMPLLLVAEMEQFTPVVSWIGSKPGSNIVVEYHVPQPARELVFMAHYDSKSDFWDHEQRARVYRLMLPFFGLAIALALWTFAVRRRPALGRGAPRAVALALATLYLVYMCMVALGFGGFVFVDQRHDSPGTVDNATSVTALLVLAKNIQQHKVNLGTSNVTIVLTGGEEVILQGAHHYVNERLKRGIDPTVPVSLVNLELVGQAGNLSYARGSGVFLKFHAPDPALRTPPRGRIVVAPIELGHRPSLTVVVGGCGACGRRPARWATRERCPRQAGRCAKRIVHKSTAGALEPVLGARRCRLMQRGGEKRTSWLDTDKHSRTGRWRGCCRPRAQRWSWWRVRSGSGRTRSSAGAVTHWPGLPASACGRPQRGWRR